MSSEAISLMEQALTIIGLDAEQDRLRISHSLGRAHAGRALDYSDDKSLKDNESFNAFKEEAKKALEYLDKLDLLAISLNWTLVDTCKNKDITAARTHYNIVKDITPLTASNYITVGNLYYHEGKIDDAIKTVREAMRKASKNQENDTYNKAAKCIEDWQKTDAEKDEKLLEELGEKSHKRESKSKKKRKPLTSTHQEVTEIKQVSESSGEVKEDPETETSKVEDIGRRNELGDLEKMSNIEPEVQEDDEQTCTLKYWVQKRKNENIYTQGYMWRTMNEGGELKKLKKSCTVVEMPDVNIAEYQSEIADVFGDSAVRVWFVDQHKVVYREMKEDLKDWYKNLYHSFNGVGSWWNYVKLPLLELLRGIVKLFQNIFPNNHHGNLLKGIAVIDGEGKLYNMRCVIGEGYKEDIDALTKLLKFVLAKAHPDLYDDLLDDKWKLKSKKRVGSNDFTTFMTLLKDYKNDNRYNFYSPLFWTHQERIYFSLAVYDLLYVKLKEDERFEILNIVNSNFQTGWDWIEKIESEGPIRRAYKYCMKHGGDVTEKAHPQAYSIVFWRHCRTHYNDRVANDDDRKIISDIDDELNDKFHFCDYIYKALQKLIEPDYNDDMLKILKTLIIIRDHPSLIKKNISHHLED